MAASRRLDVCDLAFPMKFAKVGVVDTKQLCRLTARQAAHHLLRVGREVRCALCVQVRRQKFGVVANGDVQVFVCLGDALLDPWARFLCDRAVFFETIAQPTGFVQALSKSGVSSFVTHKSRLGERADLSMQPV